MAVVEMLGAVVQLLLAASLRLVPAVAVAWCSNAARLEAAVLPAFDPRALHLVRFRRGRLEPAPASC